MDDVLRCNIAFIEMERRGKKRASQTEGFFAVRKVPTVPFAFVLDELETLGHFTRAMFGCTAVYVDDKIVFVLRERPTARADNGVWVATIKEHHASLRAEMPSLRSITVLGVGETGWQVLPVDAPDFEESVIHACSLIRSEDARVGKVPKPRKRPGAKAPKRRAKKPTGRRS